MAPEPSTIEPEAAGDLHPIEMVAHFLLSDSLENLQETFSLLHESQHLLLNRLQVLEGKLKTQLDLAKKRDHDIALVHTRIRAVGKKLNETHKSFDIIEAKLDRLEAKVDRDK